MVCVRSIDDADVDRRRDRRLQPRQRRLDPVDRVDDVGAGLLEDRSGGRRACRSAQAASLASSGRVDRAADVADPHRRAVAIGDDDVVLVRGVGQLVVGVDRVGACSSPSMLPLGCRPWRDRQQAAHVLERQAHRRRASPDRPARGPTASAGRRSSTCATPAIWRDLLRQHGLGVVVDLGQRQRVGRRRQDHDRRVGRVHLPVGRRRRQVLRQLAAGGVDRRLHVAGGAVDVAVEVELQRDRARCPAR